MVSKEAAVERKPLRLIRRQLVDEFRKLLCQTVIGSRICLTMLDTMIRLYDADEQSDGGQAFDIG